MNTTKAVFVKEVFFLFLTHIFMIVQYKIILFQFVSLFYRKPKSGRFKTDANEDKPNLCQGQGHVWAKQGQIHHDEALCLAREVAFSVHSLYVI
jgi:hypothetical protein